MYGAELPPILVDLSSGGVPPTTDPLPLVESQMVDNPGFTTLLHHGLALETLVASISLIHF